MPARTAPGQATWAHLELSQYCLLRDPAAEQTNPSKSFPNMHGNATGQAPYHEDPTEVPASPEHKSRRHAAARPKSSLL